MSVHRPSVSAAGIREKMQVRRRGSATRSRAQTVGKDLRTAWGCQEVSGATKCSMTGGTPGIRSECRNRVVTMPWRGACRVRTVAQESADRGVEALERSEDEDHDR